MASYEKRKEELTKDLTLLKPTLPDAEYKRLEEALKQYFEVRDEVLSRMFLLCADTDYNKRESDWKDLMGKAREAVKNKLEDALSSFREPSPSGWMFSNGTAVIEHKFWSSLEKLNMGTRRDDMMLLCWSLEQKTKELETKWESLQAENMPFLEQEQGVSETIKAAMDNVIDQSKVLGLKAVKGSIDFINGINRLGGKLENKVTEAFEKYGGVNKETIGKVLTELKPVFIDQELPESGQDFGKTILEVFDKLPIVLLGIYKNNLDSYRDKIGRQIDRIIAVFQQTRRETDEFIKKNSYEVAKELYKESRNSLNSWINDLLTNGLKEDGKKVAEDLIGGLGRHLLDMEAIFDNFIRYNKGRFLDAVKPEVEEALARTQRWDNELKMLLSKGRDLEETLRQRRSDVHQLESDLNEAFEKLEAALRRLPEEVQQEFRPSIEAFKDEKVRQLKTALEQVDDITDTVQQQMSMDKLRQDFDRRALLDALRR